MPCPGPAKKKTFEKHYNYFGNSTLTSANKYCLLYSFPERIPVRSGKELWSPFKPETEKQADRQRDSSAIKSRQSP
jgi:hypothetical protein